MIARAMLQNSLKCKMEGEHEIPKYVGQNLYLDVCWPQSYIMKIKGGFQWKKEH